MPTKNLSFSGDKFVNDSTTKKDDKYSNLNLNVNHKCLAVNSVQSKSISINDGRKVSDLTEQNDRKGNNYTKTWNKEIEKSLKQFESLTVKETQKQITDKSTTNNNSTLSLHIAAFENSVTSSSANNEIFSKKKNGKASKEITQLFAVPTLMINPFEFPRQQEEGDEKREPEITEFKASQTLLNPNQLDHVQQNDDADKIKTEEKETMDDNEPLPSTSTALTNLNLPNNFDRTTLSEVILSVHNFLERLNCSETTRILRDEINRQQLLAPRHDLLEDRLEPETFEHFSRTHENTSDLIPLLGKLNDISQKRFLNGNQPSTVRLSAHAPYSLTCADAKPGPPQPPPIPVVPTFMPLRLNGFRTKDRLQTIKFGGHVPSQMILSKNLLTDYKRHARMMGHKSPIYCITFDRTGKYIITGADDNLIKVWDAQTCILRYTFRGHSGEICDLAVSHENTLLCSGSNDKTVRVWCMQKGTPKNTFKQHTGQISTVCFPSFFQGGIRYLVSVATDCSIVFYRWISETREFLDSGERFVHKEGGTARLLCASYSAGGNFAAFAGTQKNIYIYMLDVESVRCIATLKDVHTDQIDTMVWSHCGLKFVSGAHDGRVILWGFKYNTWKGQDLKLPESTTAVIVKQTTKKSTNKINSAAWTLDDNFIFTTGTDCFIRIWNSKTGELVKSLKGHDKPAYYMRAHPTNFDLIISAGYDGNCLIWDASTLNCIKKIVNTDDSSKSQSIFDAALSPDGKMCAFADDSGHLTINGIFVNEKAKKVPKQQFFNTDYNRCVNDSTNGYVYDTVTGLQPHLCDPPLLERADNIQYPPEWQYMIPGNSARMRHPNPDEMAPGFFNAWKAEDICTTYKNMEEVIRKANFEALHHTKEYQREALKTPPKGWNAEPISIIKKPIARTPAVRQPVIELPISPDIPLNAMFDSDSDDGTYSGSSVSADSLSEEEQAVPDPLLDDENDSDYYLGYDGPDTVFRNVRRRRPNAAAAPPSTNNSGNEAGPSRPRRERRTSETAGANLSRANSVSRRINGRHTRANPVADEEIPRARRGGRGRPRAQPRVIESSDEEAIPNEATRNQAVPIENEPPQAAPTATPARNRKIINQFPDWMKGIVPRRFPYFAQIGDHVVYFPQGHLRYIDECKQQRLSNKNKPPGDVNSEEFAIIENIEYKSLPYRSTLLTLALTDRNNVRTGKRIRLHHHDINNIPDFIVLRQYYDISVGYNFATGDEVEALIDDKWWIGTIQARDFEGQGDYNGSQLNSVEIKWENEPNSEKLSPWELQPLTTGRRNGTLSTPEDNELFGSYLVKVEDWPLPSGGPDVGRNTELARDYFLEKLNVAIQQLNRLPRLSPFQHPVDLRLFPEYADTVAYPIDLQTISERITNKYYRTLCHLKKDIQMIAVNATKFNQRSSDIAVDSKRLVQTLFYILDTVNPPNAADYFHSLEETSPSELTAYEQDLSLKTVHESTRKRDKRSASSINGEFSSSRNIKDVWMGDCRTACDQVLNEEAKALIGEYEEEENSVDEVLKSFEEKKYKSPLELLSALTELIQSCLNSSERRSANHRSLNTLNQTLENKFKPIIEKFNRMANERTNIREKRAAALNASSAWRNDPQQSKVSVSGNRELRTRRNIINGEHPMRRSARYHQEVNYAELNQGNVSRAGNEEDSNNDYLNSQPGPSRRSQSNIRSPTSRVASKTPPNNQHESFENDEIDEEEIPVVASEEIEPNTVASSPSVNQENDSDYVGEEDAEDEPDYEEEAVVEPPLSSESEETAVSTGNSSTSSRPQKKIKRGKRKVRASTDSASSRSSEENIRKSNRKRKAKARQVSPEPPRKKAKPQSRRPVRSARANKNYDEDSEEEEYHTPTTTRSGRQVQKKHY